MASDPLMETCSRLAQRLSDWELAGKCDEVAFMLNECGRLALGAVVKELKDRMIYRGLQDAKDYPEPGLPVPKKRKK